MELFQFALVLCLPALIHSEVGPDAQTDPIRVSAQELADDFERDPQAARQKYAKGVVVTGTAVKESRRDLALQTNGKVKVWVNWGHFTEHPQRRVGTEFTTTGTILNFINDRLDLQAESVRPLAAAPAPQALQAEAVRASAHQLAEEFERDPQAAGRKYRRGVMVSGKGIKFSGFVELETKSKVKVLVDWSRFADDPRRRVGTEFTVTGKIGFKDNDIYVDAQKVTPEELP
jgi:hypothetical protein